MEAVLPTTLFSFSFGPPGNFNPSEYGASDVLDEPVRVRTRHGAKFLDLIPQSPPSLSGSCSTSTTDEETSSPSDLETRFKGDLLAEKLSALLNKTDSQKLLRIPIETGKDGTDSETTSSDIASESAASMKLTLDHRRGSLWVPGRDDTEELNPGEQRTLFGEIGFMSNFLMHQVSTLTSGVASFLWKGVARPSWDSRLHVTLHWLRNQLNFAEHSIQRARQFSQQVDLDYQPKGCKVISRHFSVARRELLRFEAEALRIHKKFRYPIPPEVDERGEPVFYKDYCLDGEWLLDEGWKESMGATKKVILYIHGGAFCLGDTGRSRNFTSRLRLETRYDVFAVNYRLAPEAPFPAGLHDSFAAFLYLTSPSHATFTSTPCPDSETPFHSPIAPEDIILMGDSAGGGLCMALLIYLKKYLKRADGSPMLQLPGAVVLFSPWIDLTYRSPSWKENAAVDWLPSRVTSLHDPLLPKSPENPTGLDNPVYMYILGTSRQRVLPLPSSDRRRSMTPLSVGPKLARQQQLVFTSAFMRSSDTSGGGGDGGGGGARGLVGEAGEADEEERARVRVVVEAMIEHPLVSPVFNNDYAGMPPLLILAGDAEVLRDESIQLARKYAYSCSNAAREGEQDGNPVVELPGRGWDGAGKRKEKESWTRKSVVRHELYKDMVHVWAVMMGRLPMARRALQNVAKFLTRLEGGDELLDYEGGDGVEVNAHLQ